MNRIRAALMMIALAGSPGDGHAECLAVPLCDAVVAATTVFVGDVERVDFARGLQHVRLSHVDVLKRDAPLTAVLEFVPSLDSHWFVAGERVLVFARREPDGAWSTQCTPTRTLARTGGVTADERTLVRRYARAVPEHDEPGRAGARGGKTCRELDHPPVRR